MKRSTTILRAMLAIILLVSILTPAFAASVTDFSDVSQKDWFYDYVRIACDNNLISGTSATTFSPNASMTRGQFVTLLGRFANANAGNVVNTGKFSDVPAGEYFTPYVYWALGKGIVSGLTETNFGPNDNLTKEQMATLLIRYADNEKITITPGDDASTSFVDAASISGYAQSSVNTLKNTGILTGDSSGMFLPQKAINRAEATTLFVRFASAIGAIGNPTEPTPPPTITPTPPPTSDPNVIDCRNIYAYIVNADGYSIFDMSLGETKQINLRFVPENTTIDRTCTYESADTSILTVDSNGVIKAVGTGTSWIKVTASNGVTANCGIDVRNKSAQIVDFGLPAYEWSFGTFTDSENEGRFLITEDVNKDPATYEYYVGISDSQWLLAPHMIYSDGFHTTRTTENINLYGITYTSSNPALVRANANGTLTVNRVLGENEQPQTATITATCGFLNKSKTVTVTVYPQPAYTIDNNYMTAFSKEVVRLVNIERTKLGIAPITHNVALLGGATLRAQELHQLYMSTRPDGSAVSTAFPIMNDIEEVRLRDLNTHAKFFSAEQLANTVTTTWMWSQSSKELLLSNGAQNVAVGIFLNPSEIGFYCSYITSK